MTKLARMLCLVLIVSALIFPASAFASSNKEIKSQKSFFSSITELFSFFGNGSSKKDDYGKYYSDKDWGHDPWSKGGKDKNKEKDKGKDKDPWDKDKFDSRKLWENYYCW